MKQFTVVCVHDSCTHVSPLPSDPRKVCEMSQTNCDNRLSVSTQPPLRFALNWRLIRALVFWLFFFNLVRVEINYKYLYLFIYYFCVLRSFMSRTSPSRFKLSQFVIVSGFYCSRSATTNCFMDLLLLLLYVCMYLSTRRTQTFSSPLAQLNRNCPQLIKSSFGALFLHACTILGTHRTTTGERDNIATQLTCRTAADRPSVWGLRTKSTKKHERRLLANCKSVASMTAVGRCGCMKCCCCCCYFFSKAIKNLLKYSQLLCCYKLNDPVLCDVCPCAHVGVMQTHARTHTHTKQRQGCLYALKSTVISRKYANNARRRTHTTVFVCIIFLVVVNFQGVAQAGCCSVCCCCAVWRVGVSLIWASTFFCWCLQVTVRWKLRIPLTS